MRAPPAGGARLGLRADTDPPGFREFVELAREEDWRLVVVSSGFNELIEPMLQREGIEGIEVVANHVDPRPEGWVVDWRYGEACPVCGQSCKRATVDALAEGGEVVYVGDGYWIDVPASPPIASSRPGGSPSTSRARGSPTSPSETSSTSRPRSLLPEPERLRAAHERDERAEHRRGGRLDDALAVNLERVARVSVADRLLRAEQRGVIRLIQRRPRALQRVRRCADDANSIASETSTAFATVLTVLLSVTHLLLDFAMQLITACCFLTVAVSAFTCFSSDAIRCAGVAADAAPAKSRNPAKHTAMIRFTSSS